MRKEKCRFPKGSVSKSRKRPFWDVGRNFFLFCSKESLSWRFLKWNLPEITAILQLYQHYFGITVKSRKNRIFHRFFYCWPWSRNNYVMIPTAWQFPVNFNRKKYTSKLNFVKKKFSILERGLMFGLKNGKRQVWDVGRNFFFFLWKKSWSFFFLGWNLPEIIIMVQLFQHYSGITEKSRKNRILYRFSYFWPWSRNNYVMIPIT